MAMPKVKTTIQNRGNKVDTLYNRTDFTMKRWFCMTKRTVGAALVLALFVVAISCNGVDIGSIGKNIPTLNNTSFAMNITNSSLNSTNGTIESLLGKSTNESSDLWNWGDVPEGYVRKGGKIQTEADLYSESVMETPSEASPYNTQQDNSGGLLVKPK
jgi:hypothetical protein